MLFDTFGRLEAQADDLAITVVAYADGKYGLRLAPEAGVALASLTGLSKGQLAQLRDEINRALFREEAKQAQPV